MGPIIAGELKFDFLRQHGAYEFLVAFKPQSLSDYYTWTGTFAAKGLWQATNPVTQTYLVQSESKDDEYKVVVMSERYSQILLGRDGEFEVIPKPSGTDLISALLFTPGCYAGEHVHDGEDAYPISLDRVSDAKIRRRNGFYSGAVVRCDYSVVTRRGKPVDCGYQWQKLMGFGWRPKCEFGCHFFLTRCFNCAVKACVLPT